MSALDVTAFLVERGVVYPTRGLVMHKSTRGIWTRTGRLAQARMWAEYAMTWHGKRTRTGVDQRWCEEVGRMTYEGCKRRARVNIYLAYRLKREGRP